MGFDLSAVDAELEQLGYVPEQPEALAQHFAGGVRSLSEVDEALHALAQLSHLDEPLYVTRPQRSTSVRPSVSAFDAQARSESGQPVDGAAEDHEEEPDGQSSWPSATASQPPFARPDSLSPESPESPETGAGAHATDAEAHEPALRVHEGDGQADQVDPQVHEVFAHESEPPREAAPLTQSQEIVLPDPIPREELSNESGEQSLDAKSPGSGSFSLDSTPLSAVAPEEREEQGELELQGRARRSVPDFTTMADNELEDALEGSRPLSIGARGLAKSGSLDMDRDPDAEFDALLSEATDPRGMPTGGLSGDFDTDDLLRGLEADEHDEDSAHVDEAEVSEAEQLTHEADELARSLYEEPEADNTEILDRASALRIEASAPDALSDELDGDDLEIVMDDDDAPAAPPMVSKGPPPPPPPSAAPEKRPSILGRLFGGKRDDE